jgi:signal transduction histidine kinase
MKAGVAGAATGNTMIEPMSELLAAEAMPTLAAALRERRERVVVRWNGLVREHLPDADELTTSQVRNSIPKVLDQIAAALEAADPAPVEVLLDITRSHGAVRFHESYNIKELILEYRILRRVLFEEMDQECGGRVSVREWMALDIAVDLALQQAVIAFIEHQKRQLKSATEAEAKFLSCLAHDLRNGLYGIMLTMQWVESSVVRYEELAEETEALRAARDGATRTIDSMERLLQAERLRKGVQVKREKVNLREAAERVVRDAQRGLGSGAGAKTLAIENRVEGHWEVISDSGLITVILQNLLGNAVKYSEQGTVAVEAEHGGDGSGELWRVSVSDQGPGIAPERVATLFEAFRRGETHGQPGVGLGLFIASQAARLLGSRLEVESTMGVGTRFSFVLRNLPATDAV